MKTFPFVGWPNDVTQDGELNGNRVTLKNFREKSAHVLLERAEQMFRDQIQGVLYPLFFYLTELAVFNNVAVDVVQKAFDADFDLSDQSLGPDLFHLKVLIFPWWLRIIRQNLLGFAPRVDVGTSYLRDRAWNMLFWVFKADTLIGHKAVEQTRLKELSGGLLNSVFIWVLSF